MTATRQGKCSLPRPVGADDHGRRSSTSGRSKSPPHPEKMERAASSQPPLSKAPPAHRFDLAGHSGCLKDNESVIFGRIPDETHFQNRVPTMRVVPLMRVDPSLWAQEIFVFFLKRRTAQAGLATWLLVWSALFGGVPPLGMALRGFPVAEEELLVTIVPSTGAASTPSRLPAVDRNSRGALSARPLRASGSVSGLGVAADPVNLARNDQARRNGLGGPLRL